MTRTKPVRVRVRAKARVRKPPALLRLRTMDVKVERHLGQFVEISTPADDVVLHWTDAERLAAYLLKFAAWSRAKRSPARRAGVAPKGRGGGKK